MEINLIRPYQEVHFNLMKSKKGQQNLVRLSLYTSVTELDLSRDCNSASLLFSN
jgi:hypothetical protein